MVQGRIKCHRGDQMITRIELHFIVQGVKKKLHSWLGLHDIKYIDYCHWLSENVILISIRFKNNLWVDVFQHWNNIQSQDPCGQQVVYTAAARIRCTETNQITVFSLKFSKEFARRTDWTLEGCVVICLHTQRQFN